MAASGQNENTGQSEQKPAWFRYGVAVLSVGAACGLQFAFDAYLRGRYPFLFFFAAIAFSALVGGFGPSVFATVLGSVVATYFFIPPRYSFSVQASDGVAIVLFLFVGAIISFFARLLHHAKQVAQAQAKELARERARLQVTLSSIGDAVIATDTQGAVVYLNPAATALTGWSAAEAKGQPLREVFKIISESTRQPVEDPVTKVLREGLIVGLANHTLLINKSGKEIPVADSGAPIRDEGRQIMGVVLVFRDATEERRMEELQASLQTALDAAEMGTWDLDRRHDKAARSLRHDQIFGYDHLLPDWSYERFIQHVLPEDRDYVAEQFRQAEQTDTLYFEARIRRADGAERWIAARGRVYRGEQAQPIRLAGVVADITGRKQAEEARSRLAAIVETAEDAIISKSLEGTITSWNQAAERLLGYTADEIIGQPITLLIPARLQSEEDAILARLRRGELIEHFETVRVSKGGREFPVSLSISPVKDRNGKITGASKILRDISARKRMEEELRAARQNLEKAVAERTRELIEANERLKEVDRIKSEFLSTMSHELRTPLNSIIGFTEIVKGGLAGSVNPEQSHMLTMAYNSGKHLLHLINGLLDLARIESGKVEPALEWLEARAVIAEAVDTIKPLADRKSLRIETDLQLPPRFCTDRKMLFQTVLNLLTNAVKFTERGSIKVDASIRDHKFVLSVVDTGIGIKAEQMGTLFEAFRQIDGSARRRYEGTGLGLYLCKKLVTLLGGEIWAESEFGKGSRFTFTLPVADE